MAASYLDGYPELRNILSLMTTRMSKPSTPAQLGVPVLPELPAETSFNPYNYPVAVRERFRDNPRWAPANRKDIYQPWVATPNATAAEKAISGDIYDIWIPSTDGIGNAWVNPNAAAPAEHKYYCHGYGLGTYNTETMEGYTIDSGSTKKVLADKSLFTTVQKERKYYIRATREGPGNDANAQYFDIKAGDIVAFWAYYNKKHEQVSLMLKDYAPFTPGTYLAVFHTARIKTPIFKKGTIRGWYLSEDTVLTSKNGPQPLRDYTLRELLNVNYRETTSCGVYRHAEGAMPGMLTDEQRAQLVASKATSRARADTIEAGTHTKSVEDRAMAALLEEPVNDPEFPEISSSSSGSK
ncbi:MAG: hypothetical protein M1836_001534 [Candelina mexicana]|nr:MAG: hypothetical protein M1836_001534 [Candelina mexicana]